MEKAHYTMDKWGYTGSACIPMTLDDAVEQGKVRRGRPGGLLRQRRRPVHGLGSLPLDGLSAAQAPRRTREERACSSATGWAGAPSTGQSALAVVDVAKGEAGRFTYRALNARAEALGGWLRDVAGVKRGDRVGLVAHNGVEYLDAALRLRQARRHLRALQLAPARQRADRARCATPRRACCSSVTTSATTWPHVQERLGDSPAARPPGDEEPAAAACPYAETLLHRPTAPVTNDG